MKTILKRILQCYLKYITKLVLLIHRPTIIAIAGSANKTFVKEKVSQVLRELGKNVRANPKSFNTEIGLPLAILYLPSGYNSYKDWLPIIVRAFLAVFQRNFPDYLVLELGVSDPGDMKYLLTIIKPKVAIITDITQRYLESFSDMDKLVGEYEYLVKKVKPAGLVILNYDNIRIKNLTKIAKVPVEFFGLEDGAHWRAVQISRLARQSPCLPVRAGGRRQVSEGGGEKGFNVNISHNNVVNKYYINRFGNHHIYSLLISLIIKNYVKKEKTGS